MLAQFRPALMVFLLLTVITGLVYPLVITGAAQIFFPKKANGSIIDKNGTATGSELIGQYFDDPRYFWGRPSATEPFPYNATASSGSNLGPGNPALTEVVLKRIRNLIRADPTNHQQIPVDLVTTSGSGLDPHISIAAAMYQASRVARTRKLELNVVMELIDLMSENRQWGFLGEPRVNVLLLNLALDGIQ
jgi:K+-transporting ATPase ATPase C chain